MTRQELGDVYRELWDMYYDDAHVERIMRRNAAGGRMADTMVWWCMQYYGSLKIENIHPLEAGQSVRQAQVGKKIEFFSVRFALEINSSSVPIIDSMLLK